MSTLKSISIAWICALSAGSVCAQTGPKSGTTPPQAEETRRFEKHYEVGLNDTFSGAGRRWALNEGVEIHWYHPTDLKISTEEQQTRTNQAIQSSVDKQGGLGKNLVAAVDGLVQALNRQAWLRPSQENLGKDATELRGGWPMARICVFGKSADQPDFMRITWLGESCDILSH